MRKNGWMLALGGAIIILVVGGLTIGRGWLRRAPEASDTNILATGAGPTPVMDENALVAANAERPYRAPPSPVRPQVNEVAAPATPPALGAPRVEPDRPASEPAEEAEEDQVDKPIDDGEGDPGK